MLLKNVTCIRVNCYQYHKLLNSNYFIFIRVQMTSKPAINLLINYILPEHNCEAWIITATIKHN